MGASGFDLELGWYSFEPYHFIVPCAHGLIFCLSDRSRDDVLFLASLGDEIPGYDRTLPRC